MNKVLLSCIVFSYLLFTHSIDKLWTGMEYIVQMSCGKRVNEIMYCTDVCISHQVWLVFDTVILVCDSSMELFCKGDMFTGRLPQKLPTCAFYLKKAAASNCHCLLDILTSVVNFFVDFSFALIDKLAIIHWVISLLWEHHIVRNL